MRRNNRRDFTPRPIVVDLETTDYITLKKDPSNKDEIFMNFVKIESGPYEGDFNIMYTGPLKEGLKLDPNNGQYDKKGDKVVHSRCTKMERNEVGRNLKKWFSEKNGYRISVNGKVIKNG